MGCQSPVHSIYVYICLEKYSPQMDTMFETLLQLPLFQGLAQEDFTNILGKVKLHFVRHKPGEVIATAGDVCDKLTFVLRGRAGFSKEASDGSYRFVEYFDAPCVIEPHSLFGMNTVYVSTCMAQTECHTVSVSKQFVLRELMRYEIFWLNYMNIVSNRAQTLHAKLWAGFPDGMEARVRHFLLSHMERLSGEKMLKIKMETLARILNETRLNVSRTLNSMQERGLVELRRGEVLVPEAAYLLPDGL